ncbi:Rv2175c family DNA-binding protein [Galactobacter sp.]|uniref:Rv2175c family DNA-binding protein n=1 Tax=Galactobacter sp. TaxID=2676125 RepID=UPI0025C45F2D|nr:Rv2175c family DNA-binding protein [Galactobacter sp.]
MANVTDTTELDALVEHWLTVPDLVEVLDVDLRHVRKLLDTRALVAVRRGERNVVSVPADFVQDRKVVESLAGTVTVLSDAGYNDAELIGWLFTPDETLPGTPIEALRTGRKTEIRRRAQALAW